MIMSTSEFAFVGSTIGMAIRSMKWMLVLRCVTSLAARDLSGSKTSQMYAALCISWSMITFIRALKRCSVRVSLRSEKSRSQARWKSMTSGSSAFRPQRQLARFARYSGCCCRKKAKVSKWCICCSTSFSVLVRFWILGAHMELPSSRAFRLRTYSVSISRSFCRKLYSVVSVWFAGCAQSRETCAMKPSYSLETSIPISSRLSMRKSSGSR
mmetsp:Transcript_30549/g.87686  ORF Transcript_30549/g.87686 Transcript_30549/m.87686 type:complete len:212 (-) Transcript_30549:761-1396(-)